MNNFALLDVIYGPIGTVWLYSIHMVIIGMTLLVSLRLLLARRKSGGFPIIAALGMLLLQYGQLMIGSLCAQLIDVQAFTALLLKALAFVTLNIGIYRLYNPARKRDFVMVTLFLLATAAASSTYWLAPEWLQSGGDQTKLLRPLGPELYIFALLFLSFVLVNPRVGQNGKYQAMLTVYFAAHTLHMANLYLFDGAQPVLGLLERTLPLAFHIVLFMFIFERVIEIMQASFASSAQDSQG